MCVSPVSVAVSLRSRAAERCSRMCQEPGLELGGCLLTVHRRMEYTARDTHTARAACCAPRGRAAA
eukprot:5858380-Prymnesium_polylepis.1